MYIIQCKLHCWQQMDGHRHQDGQEPPKLHDTATRQDLDPNRHPQPTKRTHRQQQQEPPKLQASSTQDTQASKQSLREKYIDCKNGFVDWIVEQTDGLKNCYCPCKELGKVGFTWTHIYMCQS